MKKTLLLLLCITSLLAKTGHATTLRQQELSKLFKEAEIVVVAKVEKVTPVDLDAIKSTPYDEVTLIISNTLKGDKKQKTISIILEPRGVRGFDPHLKQAQSGVFFLRKDSHGRIRPHTPGSIALFENTNFVATK